MRLCFVTGSLVHGGAERHTITLANRLAERGHHCHFAYVKNDPSQLGRIRDAASVECLHAVRYLDPAAVQRLRQRLRQSAPDVVIAANQYALMYARLAMRGLRTPLLVTYHTTLLRNAREWLQMLWYRPFFWSAERLVFVCEAQRLHWRARGVAGRRSEVIYNGVDLEHWRPVREEERTTLRGLLGLPPDAFVVGMSAVLRPEKNHVQLVEAIARLRRRGIAAHALLIGDGETRGLVEERARRLGVAPALIVTGLQKDVRPLVGACDAMALCSTAVETFSLAALEAMALARPVVHADIGGAKEMIHPGHDGFLFPVNDTGTLVEKLAALADPALQRELGANARRTVEERFSERTMIERYESILMELAATGSKRESLRRSATAH
jgi:glycosyltransferase involved in cell wall biosynthesis